MQALLLFLNLLGELALFAQRVLNISPYAATFGGLMGLHSLPTVLIGPTAGAAALATMGLAGLRRHGLG